MNRMRYVGHLRALKGRTALIVPHQRASKLLAQFDYPPGTEFNGKGGPQGVLEPIAHMSKNDMVPSFSDEHPECFGWHTYSFSDFEPVDENISADARIS